MQQTLMQQTLMQQTLMQQTLMQQTLMQQTLMQQVFQKQTKPLKALKTIVMVKEEMGNRYSVLHSVTCAIVSN
jgi:hypothetical protein